LRPPFTGASATSFALRLTSCVNLPAPGRRQCVYVGLEYALAHTCVFAKQSLDAILCGRGGLGVYPLTYYRHPFSRSYAVILPSSFSVNHSSTCGYSPRPPLSDYGTLSPRPRRVAFLAFRFPHPSSGACAIFPLGLRLPG